MDQKRIEYIDALRGFAILLVVFMHVPQYGFHQEVGGMYMLMAKMLAVPLLIVLMVIVVIMVATYVLQSNVYVKKLILNKNIKKQGHL